MTLREITGSLTIVARVLLLVAIYQGSRLALIVLLAWMQIRIHREITVSDVSDEARARLHRYDDDQIH